MSHLRFVVSTQREAGFTPMIMESPAATGWACLDDEGEGVVRLHGHGGGAVVAQVGGDGVDV